MLRRNSYLSAMIRSKKIVARRGEQELVCSATNEEVRRWRGELSSDRANLARSIPSGVF